MDITKIHKDQIVTNKKKPSNRQYKYTNKITKSELIEYELNEETYLFFVNYDNIGHFLHDHFLLFYSIWREKKRKVLVYLNNNFYIDFVISTLGSEYVEIIEDKYLYIGKNKNIILTPEYNRNLRKIKKYKFLLNEIKEKCFNYNNITEDRHLNILYGRQDLNRKKLLNIDIENLENNNIKVIDNLSKYTFKETLDLLSKCKNFIYVFGAGLTYLVFLPGCRILEIHPNKNDSWTQRFGLGDICNLNIFVTKNTKPSNYDKITGEKGQGNKKLDDNIIYDNELHKHILQFIEGSK